MSQREAEKFENEYVAMWIQDGILFAKLAEDLEMTLPIAKACVESRIYFSKGESYPLLIDMIGVKSTSKEARKYMATVGSTLVKAGALLTGSVVSRTIGNIFLKIDRPPVPMNLFTDERKAREWLLQFVHDGIPR